GTGSAGPCGPSSARCRVGASSWARCKGEVATSYQRAAVLLVLRLEARPPPLRRPRPKLRRDPRSGADSIPSGPNRQVCDRLRNRYEEPLRERHTELSQPPHDLAALDALGDRLDLERLGHTRNRLDDAFVRGVVRDVAHELAVDLDVVDG